MSTPQPYDQPLPIDLDASLAAVGAAVGEAAGLRGDTADPTEDLYDEDGLPSQIARQVTAAEKPARKLGDPAPVAALAQFSVRVDPDLLNEFNKRVRLRGVKKQAAADEALQYLWEPPDCPRRG